MPKIPELSEIKDLDTKKAILWAAAGIVLGTAALKRTLILDAGRKIYSTSFWDNHKTVFADVVDDGTGKSGRLTGTVTFGEGREVVDVVPDDIGKEPTEAIMGQMVEAFLKNDWENPPTIPDDALEQIIQERETVDAANADETPLQEG